MSRQTEGAVTRRSQSDHVGRALEAATVTGGDRWNLTLPPFAAHRASHDGRDVERAMGARLGPGLRSDEPLERWVRNPEGRPEIRAQPLRTATSPPAKSRTRPTADLALADQLVDVLSFGAPGAARARRRLRAGPNSDERCVTLRDAGSASGLRWLASGPTAQTPLAGRVRRRRSDGPEVR